MSNQTRAPAIEGWYTMDPQAPHLIGARCQCCGTYYFPKMVSFCRNPGCAGDAFDEVELSRTGKVWSYTNACYEPPVPYIAADPFMPFAIAAVELDTEKMIVLGQVAEGIDIDQLQLGMEMELVLEPLCVEDGTEKMVWKWKPVSGA